MNNDNLPEFADAALKNATGPLSKSVGETLNDIWYLVIGGHMNYAVEKRRLQYVQGLASFKKQLEQNVQSIPASKRTEPPTQLAMKALSEAQYCIEEPELRAMFASLIANSMNADKSNRAHPFFASIISGLSPFEARLFASLAAKPTHPIAKYNIKTSKDAEGYLVHSKNILSINGAVRSDYKEVASSLDILESAGLITLDYESHMVQEKEYEPFYLTDLFHRLSLEARAVYSDTAEVQVVRGILSITALGQNFAAICLS